MDAYVTPLILLAIAVFAVVVGNYVSKRMRLPDTGWKVTLIIGVIGIGALVLQQGWPPRQGIDLKGGVILIYEVDEALTEQTAARRAATTDGAPAEASGDVDMQGLIQALSRRINPGGVQEIVVRRYGENQVEIIIPDVTDAEVERIKKLITTGGFLKFQIVADQRDYGHLWALAEEARNQGQYQVRDENGVVVGQWVKLGLTEDSTPDDPIYRVDPPQAKSRMVRGRKEVLMVVNPNLSLRGVHLQSVRKGYQDMSPAVFFETTMAGARRMEMLTETHLPDTTSGHYSLLGIVMDNELLSAPRINSRISTSGVIEGQFTDAEVELLVNVLRAGRLPAVLRPEPISQNQVSPLLGTDTIRQGRIAIGISLVAVLIFMLIYYRFAGIVACLALMLNLMLILALMIFVGAAFSLPGMAALVLTVGMSVDASVLIFERIREERRSGSALRLAVRNGFGRATRTIVDANLTTLITAIVLYLIGTEQLKAFAIALIFGILMTLFSAIFFARVLFELYEKSGRLKRLSMLTWFADVKLNLFAHRRLAGFASIVLICIGLGAVGTRGSKIFDIDFLGGTSVQILLKEPMAVADVRQRAQQLQEDGLVPDVSVTEVQSQEHGNGRIYRIDTSLPEEMTTEADVGSTIDRVKKALIEQFQAPQGTLLETHSLDFTSPKPFTGSGSPTSDTTETERAGSEATEVPTTDDPSAAQPNAADSDSSDSEIAPGDQLDSLGTQEGSENEGADSVPADTDQSRRSNHGSSPLAYSPQSLRTVRAALGQMDDPTTAATTPQTTDLIDASALRSESKLTLDEPMDAETMDSLIRETAEKLNLGQPDVVLSHPEWDGRSSRPFDTWTVQMSTEPATTQRILASLEERLDGSPVWLAANQIGSSVAGDKTRLAVGAVVGSLIGIIAYIWFRFQHVTYGLAAVVALIHDVLITLGAIALSFWLQDVLGFLMIDEFKISLPVVAAFLTIIGYSLNDTIVLFDRIREVRGKSPYLNAQMINHSINQTLSRTLLTSLTTLLAVVILYVIGGQGIHAFAFALLVGVIVGTYSSIFIAAPSLHRMSRVAGEAEEPAPQKVTA